MTTQQPFIPYTPPSTPVLMEEIYQNLVSAKSEPEQMLRRASGAIYKDTQERLSLAGKRAQPHLDNMIRETLNLDEDTYTGFLAGKDTPYQIVRDAITGYLGHTGPGPHDKGSNSRKLAVKWLVKAMTKALLEQHCKSNPDFPLAFHTWDRFLQGSHSPSQATMQAIRVFLRLDNEQYDEIYRLTRKNYLYDLARVRPRVEQEWAMWKRRMNRAAAIPRTWDALETFWDKTAVSPKAMRGLGCTLPKEQAPAEKTTQGTMLKLAVAFQFDPMRAEEFLALLDSGFYDLRDMLFCSCLYLKIYEPAQVHALLQPYAYNSAAPSTPRFDNPYQEAFGEGPEK